MRTILRRSFAHLPFHPIQPYLATLGEKDTVIRILTFDINKLVDQPSPPSQTDRQSMRYTTAKIVLVGDPGIGKHFVIPGNA
jgi:hypothetical protein